MSVATGAVGSAAVAVARARGCARVVGIAGGPRKCAHAREVLGYDECVDDRAHASAASLSAALAEACPQGIDCSFENVGGLVQNAVLPRMNAHGRIAVCGLVAGYDGAPIPLEQPALLLTSSQRSQDLGFQEEDAMDGITHEVINQPAVLENYNLFATNRPMQDALRLNAPTLDTARLRALGAALGTSQMLEHARLANSFTPQLHAHDRFGRRTDTVEFHPSYHALMSEAVAAGLHSRPWEPENTGVATGHMERAAGFMLFTEIEASVLCPISMTYAVRPALRGNAAILRDLEAGLSSREYDPRLALWSTKRGLTMGMGMTEKQGGSDVRANSTRAEADGSDTWGERFRVTGHKWFMSAPMCDAFLILAQTPAGLGCFFLPRVLPDGSLNAIRIQRLKDKLGNQANASSEVEFFGASAWLVGVEGRGITQILEMGTLTRLDCALGTSGLMRQALALAFNHTTQRSAFGKLLSEQPLMRNVLADMALESEAATALALRLARAFDRARDEHERIMARLLTPVAKFWICKRGSLLAQEAMECLGGNGYVEAGGEGVMARIYREMPLNSIWEGAGNIMAIDLLRAIRKADAAAALVQELAPARGAHKALDALVQALPHRVDAMATEVEARRLAQDIALAVQAALLCQSAPPAVFAAFCASRLGGDWGHAFGTLGAGTDFDAILARTMPT